MNQEPIITTNNMSADEVAAWITEKARALQNCNHSVLSVKERSVTTSARWPASMKTSPDGKTSVL